MKARAKRPHRTIRAFTGREFVSYEWRRVPEDSDDEAERLEAGGYLELKNDPPAVVAAPSVVKVDATRGAITLALESNLDLATIAGSGDGGRILKTDVEDALWDEEE